MRFEILRGDVFVTFTAFAEWYCDTCSEGDACFFEAVLVGRLNRGGRYNINKESGELMASVFMRGS